MGSGQSDIRKYYGRWYEVTRTANPFETRCASSTADYIPSTYNPDGPFTVVNTCFYRDEQTGEMKWYQTIGEATLSEFSQLFVQFTYELGPNGGRRIHTPPSPYNILWTDYENYSIVGGGPFFWILSRRPQVSQEELVFLFNKAAQLGVDAARWI